MKTLVTKWLLVTIWMLAFAGCGDGVALVGNDESSEPTEASFNPVTSVNQSEVERQSIGNCWLYAGASWVESLNKAATGVELDTSQSYVTYWHWFDQITRGGGKEIRTGGSYATVVDLYLRYGLMTQAEFLPEEATAEMSARQSQALAAINESLKSGALSTSAARSNRATVRAELDRVWRLRPDAVGLLNAVFGANVSKTLDRGYTTQAPPTFAGLRVLRAADIAVRVNARGSSTFENKTLADAIGSGWSRSGPFAWTQTYYPSGAKARRTFQKRIQRALHDHQPVIVSWFVDFNALARDGSFSLEEIARNGGPGKQGGHMVVMHDYEVDNVPGFGTLPAGVDETRPDALQAALSDAATVKFFRVKNSWGKYRPDRWDDTPLPGYHDLYRTYLDGPIKQCDTDGANCSNTTPLWDVVLPAGY